MVGDQTRSNIVLDDVLVDVLLSGQTVSNMFEHCPAEQLVLQSVIHCLSTLRLNTIRQNSQTGKCLGRFLMATHFPFGQGFLNIAYTMDMFLTQQHFKSRKLIESFFTR